MRKMYDAIYPQNIPDDSEIIAGYVDGHWPTWERIVQLFPDKLHVPISAIPSTDLTSINFHGVKTIVFDCENGDYSPSQVADDVAKARALGLIPIPYVNRDNKPVVIAQCNQRGIAVPLFWLAWPGGTYIPTDCIAVQNEYPPGVDISMVADNWPGLDPTPERHFQMFIFAARGVDQSTADLIHQMSQVGVVSCDINEAKSAIARNENVLVLGGPAANALGLKYTIGEIVAQGTVKIAVGQTAKDTLTLGLQTVA